MQVGAPNRANPEGSVLYRSAMNPKIQRNFEVFTPCDFIAAITQHIPDKSFQLVRYYGWYSNKMRGQREKRAAEEAKGAGLGVQVIDVSEHKLAPHRDEVSGAGPRRIPSAKWRELINPPSPRGYGGPSGRSDASSLVRRSFSVGGSAPSARRRCVSFHSLTTGR
jgi:hypothetical protein